MVTWQHPAESGAADPRWWDMEAILLEMRQIWFAAAVEPFHGGLLAAEQDGAMVAMVRADPAQVDRLTQAARHRRAHVVETPFSQPPDLAARLRLAGFRRVVRQGTYLYHPARGEALHEELNREGLRRRLRRWLHERSAPPGSLHIAAISAPDLPVWNRINWEVFGPRGLSEEQSLEEKRRAFAAMGDRGLWYLARLGPEPVGTAILYCSDRGAQILAVGTVARYRERGIATALVRRAIADYTRSGAPFLFLDTRPGSGAERLYLKLGFEPAYIRSIYAP